MSPLNARVASLSFKTLCDTAYPANILSTLRANPNLEQFTRDREALENLSLEYTEHDVDFWDKDTGRFTALRRMAGTMGKNLAWTGRQFFSLPKPEVPAALLFDPEQPQPDLEQGAAHQQSDKGHCSNPFEGDDFYSQHRTVHAAINLARRAVTPEKDADASFNDYYQCKAWGARWSDFKDKYIGSKIRVGEFGENAHEVQSNWNNIKFNQGWLASAPYWKPGCDDFSSPLPWCEAYRKIWDNFKSYSIAIWNSTCLQAEVPRWSCELFNYLRTVLATAAKQPIPFFTERSRPKLEDLISEPGRSSNEIYDTCLHSFIDSCRTAGRRILWLVSPVARAVKFLVKILYAMH